MTGRRVRRRLLWLVEFLRVFYGADPSQSKAGALPESTRRSGKTERVREAELSLTMAQIIRDDWSARTALGLDSQHRETWHETARTDVSAGRMAEAFHAFERAIALQQTDDVLLDYACALLVSGRPDEALAAIRSIVNRDARALAVEVGALMGLARYAEAVEASRAAAGKNFDLSSGLIVAAASLVLGLTEQAVEVLRRTLAGHRAELQKHMIPGLLEVLGLAVLSGHAILVRNLLEELGVHDALRPAYEALDIAGVGDQDRIKRLAPELQEPVALLLDRWGVVLPEKRRRENGGREAVRRDLCRGAGCRGWCRASGIRPKRRLPESLYHGGMHNELTSIIERDEEWFIAYCPEIPGANGQGRSAEEARENLGEAIALIMEDGAATASAG